MEIPPKSPYRNVVRILTRITLAVLMLGLILRVQQHPLGLPVILGAGVVLVVLQVLRLVLKERRQFSDYISILMYALFVLFFAFRMMYWPYQTELLTVLGVVSATWLITGGYNSLLLRDPEKEVNVDGTTLQQPQKGFNPRIIFAVAAIFVVYGAVAMINHWPFGNYSLIVGLVCGVVYVFYPAKG